MRLHSPPLFLLLLPLLLSVLSRGAAQPQFNASIAGLPAVTASAAVAPFASPAAPYELTYNATNVSVSLIASTPLAYQIFLSGSGGLQAPSDWRGGSLVAGASTTFVFDLSCVAEVSVPIRLIFTARTSTSTGAYDTVTTAYLTKQCHIPGCPTGCGAGACDFYKGACVCPPPYYGNSCDIVLDVPRYVCPNETFNITWSRPAQDATATDWVATLIGTDADVLTPGYGFSISSNYINWFYLPTPTNGTYPQIVGAPGEYYLTYFTQDTYTIIAGQSLTVLDWSECGYSACRNGDLCSDRGSCDSNTSCTCDAGFGGPDCSYGCSGELNITEDAFISDGTPQFVPYGRLLQCRWRLQAPEGAIGIKINFTWFGLLEGWDYLRIYASANPDPSFLLQTISGPGEFGDDGVFEVSTAATSVLIDLKTDYFGYTNDGFGAMVKMIFPPDLTWIKYHSPAAILFVVLNGLAMLTVIVCAVVIVYRYRKIFMVSTNFMFCLFIIVGVVLGLATQYTLIGRPTRGTCLARMWVPSLAFAIIFGSLSAKVFNAYRLFQKISEGESMKDDHRILLFTLGFVIIEATFLAIWTGVNPPHLSRQTDPNTVADWLVCNYRQTFWPAASLLLKGLLLILAGVISWRTRQLMTNYSESKYVALTIYNVTLSLLIAIPLIILLKRFHVALFVIWSMTVLSACFLSFCLLFGRLLYYIFFPEKAPRKASGSRSSDTPN